MNQLELESEKNYIFPEVSDFGLDIDKLFEFSKKYYKEDEKNIKINCQDTTLLVAYASQALFGPFDEKAVEGVGFYDFIGHERRNKWKSLKNLPRVEAKFLFCQKLRDTCGDEYKQFIATNAAQHSSDCEQSKISSVQCNTSNIQVNLNSQEVRDGITNSCERVVHKEGNTEDMIQKSRPICMDATETNGYHEDVSGKCIRNCSLFFPSLTINPNVENFKNLCKPFNSSRTIIVPKGESMSFKLDVAKKDISFSWEFCTDYYDVDFSILFRITSSQEEEKFDKESEVISQIDIMLANLIKCESFSHVYTLKHTSPCPGSYIVTFDNTYSILRSKTIYFRYYLS